MPAALRLALPFVLLLLVGLAVLPAGADEEADDDGLLVARFFDIDALTMGTVDFIPEQLRLVSPDMVSDEENPLFGAEAEEPMLPVGTADELIELILMNVDPVSWQITPGAGLSPVGNHSLLVQTTKPVMAKVARYLADLESQILTTVTLEVRTYSVDQLPGPATAEAVLACDPGPSVVLTALVGQRAACFAGGQKSYIQDYDVEVAEEAKENDPIVGVANHGLVVSARSRIGNDPSRLRVDLDATLVRLLGMRDHTTYENRTIQLPSIETVVVRSQLLLKPGEWYVGEGRAQGPAEGRWFFLVRATPLRVPARSASAPALYDLHVRADKGELVTRTYDVSDLYAPNESSLGQAINLVPSNFTPPEPPELPEPAPIMAIGAIADLIRDLVVPGSWKRDGTNIQTWNGRVVVTNTAQVHGVIARTLQDLRRQFLWTLALDVEAIEVPVALGHRVVEPASSGAGYLLTEAERQALSGPDATRVGRVRVICLAGARNAVVSGREFAYVQDYEVEIAKGASIANPVVKTCLEGFVADLRPALTTTRDAVHLESRLTRGRAGEIQQVSTPHGPIDALNLDITRLRSNLRIPLGETAVVGVDARDGRALVLLVTPRIDMRAE